MRKTVIFFLLLTVSAESFSQPTTTATPAVKTDYLKKSKSQKTAAWILLGSGVVLTSTAMAIGLNEATDNLIDLFTLEQPKSSNDGEILFYTGLAAMAGSIPLFIASSKNKKKANNISASFKMEFRSFVQQHAFVRIPYPALSLKLNL